MRRTNIRQVRLRVTDTHTHRQTTVPSQRMRAEGDRLEWKRFQEECRLLGVSVTTLSSWASTSKVTTEYTRLVMEFQHTISSTSASERYGLPSRGDNSGATRYLAAHSADRLMRYQYTSNVSRHVIQSDCNRIFLFC